MKKPVAHRNQRWIREHRGAQRAYGSVGRNWSDERIKNRRGSLLGSRRHGIEILRLALVPAVRQQARPPVLTVRRNHPDGVEIGVREVPRSLAQRRRRQPGQQLRLPGHPRSHKFQSPVTQPLRKSSFAYKPPWLRKTELLGANAMYSVEIRLTTPRVRAHEKRPPRAGANHDNGTRGERWLPGNNECQDIQARQFPSVANDKLRSGQPCGSRVLFRKCQTIKHS